MVNVNPASKNATTSPSPPVVMMFPVGFSPSFISSPPPFPTVDKGRGDDEEEEVQDVIFRDENVFISLSFVLLRPSVARASFLSSSAKKEFVGK